MKNSFKKIIVGFVFSIITIIGFGHTTYASYGGLIGAAITGPNQITISYVHKLANNTYSSYSNLGLGLSGRNITGTVSTTDNSITISFDGPPVAPNTTGTIDIDNTVTWADASGGFVGATAYPVDDQQQPALVNVTLTDNDHSGALNAGDTLNFWFDEPMDTSVITTDNVDSDLALTNSHTFGTTAHGLALSWNSTETILSVTLGTDETVASGDTVSAISGVTDAVGNLDNTPAPISIPTTAVISRTLYFNNAAGDNNWNTLGNWWNDSNFTSPATSLPTAYDDVVISANVFSIGDSYIVFARSLTVTGGDGNNLPADYIICALFIETSTGATFNQYTAMFGYLIGDTSFNNSSASGIPFDSQQGLGTVFSYSMIVGNVTYNDTTANYGTIVGNASFHGAYGNAGFIYGNVDFHDNTSNPGIIFGNVSFFDNSFNAGFGSGNIIGNVDVYYPSQNPIGGTPTGTVTYHGYDSPFDGGLGTSDDPYLISTCDQLQQMTYDETAHYKLTGDVDCSASAGWNGDAGEWEDGTIGGTLLPDSYAAQTHTDIIVTNNGYFGFQPIGDDTTAFSGTLDGDGHTISNLWIFRKASPLNGIFGETLGATIKNLTVSNSNIVGGQYTGGIVGEASNTSIQNVTMNNNMVRAYLTTDGGGIAGYISGTSELSNDTITGGSVHGSGNIIGGIVGQMNAGDITDSSSSATVDGGLSIGGIVGEMDGGTIERTHATGDITSNRSEYIIMKTGFDAGGFVGYMSNGSITDSSATGTVHSTGNYAGGFVGIINGGSLARDYATGDLTGVEETIEGTTYESNYDGGFAGYAGGATIDESYATGNVTTGGSDAGGFMGAAASATITKSFANGNVNAPAGPSGGFIGIADTVSITDAYASGDVSESTTAGGFIGENNNGGTYTNVYSRGHIAPSQNNGGFIGLIDVQPTISNSFYDHDVSNISDSSNVTPQTTSSLKTQSTFTNAGWDFTNTWIIDSELNNGYPTFQYFDNSTVPVLTEVAPIPSQVTADNAKYYFSSSKACTLQVSPLSESPAGGSTDIRASRQPTAGQSTYFYLGGASVGTTYSFSFSCLDAHGNQSNTLNVGPFTIIANPTSSGSGTVSGGGGSVVFDPVTQTIIPRSQVTHNVSSNLKFTRTLKLGSVGDDVKQLQIWLNGHGFLVAKTGTGSSGYETLKMGSATVRALKAFQKSKGIKPDGILGPKTAALLN